MKIIRRLARWVLREELKVYEESLDDASAFVVSTRRELHRTEDILRREQKLSGERLASIRKAQRWLATQRSGDQGIQALVEWLRDGPMGPRANTHGLHPFDRWQISPKPEELEGSDW